MTTNQDSPNTAGAAEAVAWMYETADGERTFEFNPNGDSARWLIENGYTETPLYAHPPENPPKRPSAVPDEVVEAVARIIDPGAWSVMDSYLEQTKRKYKGQNVGWPVDQFQHKESMDKARAALTASIPAIRVQVVAEERGLRDAVAKIMPIRINNGPDYAEVYFSDGQIHSTQAMTMNPQDWEAISASFEQGAHDNG